MEKVTRNNNGKLIEFPNRKPNTLHKPDNQQQADVMLAKPLTQIEIGTDSSKRASGTANPLGVKRSRYYEQKNAAINAVLAAKNDITSIKDLHQREVQLLDKIEHSIEGGDRTENRKLQENFAALQKKRDDLAQAIRSRNASQAAVSTYSISYGDQEIVKIQAPHIDLAESNSRAAPQNLADITSSRDRILRETEALEQQNAEIEHAIKQFKQSSTIFLESAKEQQFGALRSEDDANVVALQTAYKILQADNTARQTHDLSSVSESLLASLVE